MIEISNFVQFPGVAEFQRRAAQDVVRALAAVLARERAGALLGDVDAELERVANRILVLLAEREVLTAERNELDAELERARAELVALHTAEQVPTVPAVRGAVALVDELERRRSGANARLRLLAGEVRDLQAERVRLKAVRDELESVPAPPGDVLALFGVTVNFDREVSS
jgi:chromosome segregation ATPase